MHRGRRRTRMHDSEEMEDRMIEDKVGIRSGSAIHGISHNPPGEPLPLAIHPIDVIGRHTLTAQHFPRLFSSGDTCDLQRDRAIFKDVLQRSAWIVKISYATVCSRPLYRSIEHKGTATNCLHGYPRPYRRHGLRSLATSETDRSSLLLTTLRVRKELGGGVK